MALVLAGGRFQNNIKWNHTFFLRTFTQKVSKNTGVLQSRILKIDLITRNNVSCLEKCPHKLTSPNTITGFEVSKKFSTSHQTNKENEHHQNGNGYLIYVGDLGDTLKYALVGFYTIGAMILAVTPTMISAVSNHAYMPYMVGIACAFLGVTNPAIFYKFSERYVHELYYNDKTDTYTAFVTSPFVLGHRKIVFTSRDCNMPKKMTLFTSFLIHGKPVFINSDIMEYNTYARMLRHAQEFDFENPDRQSQYEPPAQESMGHLRKKKTEDSP